MDRRRTTPAPEEGLPAQGEPVTTPAPEEGLVAMVKGGEVLHVHPTCVQAHKNAGWTVQE